MTSETDVRIERDFDAYLIDIDIGNGGMDCHLSFKSREKEFEITPGTVQQMLKETGIIEGVDSLALERFCKKAIASGSVQELLVAEGTPPEPGTDANLEFLVQLSTRRPVLEAASETTAEKKEVDFHSAKRFENIVAGQKIAILHPAKKGAAGTSVKGESVPSPAVREEVTYKLGAHVLQKGAEIFATMEGRVVHEGGSIYITDEFVVSKDVDYDVGHIDFVGAVHIYGDVMDGFNVRGKKSVRVDKNVGISTIESDGDVELGGMTGRGDGGIIHCGGTINARYLDHVTVECVGDVIVKNEIMHSNIKCGGKIIVKGAIVGGECLALEGIEAVVLGSDSTTKTQLHAGVDFQHLSRILPLQEELRKVRKQSQELIARVGPYASNPDPASLPDGIKKKLASMLKEVQDFHEKRKELEEQIAAIEAEVADHKNAKINATKKLYAGTIIHLGNTTEEVRSNISKPLSAIEHHKMELRFLKYSPLTVKAQVIEAKLIEAEKAAEQAKATEQAKEKGA